MEAIACFVHTTPILTSFIELIVTRMVFLKKDAKWSLFIGLLYIPVNYFGGLYEKSPVYASIGYMNWSNKWATFGILFGQACIMPIIVYITAIITQRIHGFHEHSMTWKRDRDA